ncbi:hypothetical protein FKN04_12810 [Bacillus glycinifermentans]|uniref:hypothetical protein n=1 Tax=Bacillus glycinifermentans TaxID=1664069 RepID=UPI001581A7BC|nr:hypothetical protein [Bacillus glycinifermentans]NUJ17456.1 hypothetical protein [Bacillus glycinifermentans]
MKFDLKKPCKDCPFIKGSSTNRTLSKERLDSIVDDITNNDMTFTCHKTLDLVKGEQQHCAGALIYLEREDNPNQMMRWMERLGFYDRKKLDMTADVIDNK